MLSHCSCLDITFPHNPALVLFFSFNPRLPQSSKLAGRKHIQYTTSFVWQKQFPGSLFDKPSVDIFDLFYKQFLEKRFHFDRLWWLKMIKKHWKACIFQLPRDTPLILKLKEIHAFPMLFDHFRLPNLLKMESFF